MDTTKKVSALGRLSYAIGFAGKDGFQVIANNYFMFFFMAIAGLDPVFIGAMMLAARIWDAINDPILGSIADHTKTRFGKFRPYIFSSIPMAIIFAALLAVPQLSMGGKMVYYTVVYVLYGMCFTVLEIPYFGLVGAMTPDPKERAAVTSWSRVASRIPAFILPLIVGAIAMPAMGQEADPNGFFKIAIIVGVVAIVTSFVAFFGCKETYLVEAEPSAKKSSGFRDFLDVLKGNKALLVVMLVQLFFTFNTILCDMLNVYYVSFSLNNPGLMAGVAVSMVAVGAAVGQLAFPYILDRVKSCKNVMLIGAPIYILSLGLCYICGGISIPLYLVALVASNFFTGFLQINVVMMCFEVCDMLEHKNGVRADATVFAVVSFLMKLAAGLAATLAGWGLALVGFTGGFNPRFEGEVTAAMASGVAVLRFAMPAVLVLISVLLTFLYPITKEQIAKVRAELEERHSRATAVS